MEIIPITSGKVKINYYNYWNNLTFYFIEDSNYIYVKSDIENLEKLKPKHANINKDSVLYFGKTSKFPRHKLKETSLKRCIKPEKSDIQVIGSLQISKQFNAIVFIGDNIYYILDISHCSTYASWQEKHIEKDDPDFISKVMSANECLHNTVVSYIGPIIILEKNVFEDLVNIENKVYNNIITDSELDAFINKDLESLTVDTCDLLYDLLNSKDYQSMELGLKMLVGFNVNECPNTIKLLLSNSHLSELKAWNSVGVNQVKNSIKINEYFNYQTDYNIIENDLDKELSRYVWKKMSIKQIDEFASRFNLPGLVFKVYAE